MDSSNRHHVCRHIQYIKRMWLKQTIYHQALAVLLLSASLLVYFYHVKVGEAKVEVISLPENLQHNFDIMHQMGDLNQQSGQMVFWCCLQQYISKFTTTQRNMNPREATFFRSTVNRIMAPIYSNSSRNKRQASRTRFRPKIRREVRMLTLLERQTYFRAVLALKNDRRLSPNIYDVLQRFHEGDNIARAHFGPAFPAWHRLYLWLYEEFLRLHFADVTVPYWASNLDDGMTDPTQSVIWSPGFFGNGQGALVEGPFAGWNVTRFIGGGPLYTYAGIANILAQRQNRDILFPTALPGSNFEMQHGGPHTFVGGSMNSLQDAVRDPIFYSHHAYVDQIWERFRYLQVNNGIDPQADYPFIDNDPRFNPQHRSNETMGFFPNNELSIDFPNSLGYSNIFFRLVQYEQLPFCPDCGRSPYLFCNSRNQCQSRTIAELQGTRLIADIMSLNLNPRQRIRRSATSYSDFPSCNITNTDCGSSMLTCDTTSNPPHCRAIVEETIVKLGKSGTNTNTNSNTIHRRKRRTPVVLSSASSCRRPASYLPDYDIKTLGHSATPSSSGISRDWVYVPVTVISKRPPSFNEFSAFSLYHNKDPNLSTMSRTGNKASFLHSGTQYKFDRCDEMNDPVGKLTIVSYGINYEGYSQEYAIVDNRLGVSQSKAFVPVKAPSSSNPSEAAVAAFDACGRICKPFCKSGQKNNRFPGAIRVSASQPLQFGHSYAEATLNSWTLESETSCPSLEESNIPLSFYCDYMDDWVWSTSFSSSSSSNGETETSIGSSWRIPGGTSISGPGSSWRIPGDTGNPDGGPSITTILTQPGPAHSSRHGLSPWGESPAGRGRGGESPAGRRRGGESPAGRGRGSSSMRSAQRGDRSSRRRLRGGRQGTTRRRPRPFQPSHGIVDPYERQRQRARRD